MVVVQFLRLVVLKRGTWWVLLFLISGCPIFFGLALLLAGMAVEDKLGYMLVSAGEGATLGEIVVIMGIGLLTFVTIARWGWLTRKLW